jgi:outer membrane protein TolC
VQRDVSVAWLDVWQAQRAHAIAEATLRDAELQARSVQAAAGAGTAPPADLAMARVNTERYRDAVAARAQSIATARAVLSRWIGAEADRPIPDEAPPSAVAPDVAALLASLPEHPELAALQARVDEADVDARLADVAHAPDWRVEVGYGNRRDYSDMVLLKVGMDLPLFRRDRQDRDLASALALRDAARAEREDATRRLAAEVRRAYVELLALTAREHGYQTVIVPQTGSVIDAALAAWRSGSGSLAQVLEARRTRLDAQLAQLDLAADAARARIELVYLTGTGAQS